MDQQSDIGFWELSIIMVVIASWILYRYVAPKGWREWTRAGLVQAFIIALYAEMYGFPLTIYLLTGWLGIKLPWAHDTGHLWAYLFGWGPLGAMVEMLVGYTFVLPASPCSPRAGGKFTLQPRRSVWLQTSFTV